MFSTHYISFSGYSLFMFNTTRCLFQLNSLLATELSEILIFSAVDDMIKFNSRITINECYSKMSTFNAKLNYRNLCKFFLFIIIKYILLITEMFKIYFNAIKNTL